MNNNQITNKQFFNSNFVLMVSSDNEHFKNKTFASYRDFKFEPLMLYKNGLIQQTLTPDYEENIIFYFVDYESTLNFVKNNYGISIVPKLYTDSWSKDKKSGIKFLEITEFKETMKVSQIFKKDNNFTTHFKNFISISSSYLSSF